EWPSSTCMLTGVAVMMKLITMYAVIAAAAARMNAGCATSAQRPHVVARRRAIPRDARLAQPDEQQRDDGVDPGHHEERARVRLGEQVARAAPDLRPEHAARHAAHQHDRDRAARVRRLHTLRRRVTVLLHERAVRADQNA